MNKRRKLTVSVTNAKIHKGAIESQIYVNDIVALVFEKLTEDNAVLESEMRSLKPDLQ